MSQVVTLYSDKERTDALYPRTKVSGISDDNNTSLEELLNRYEIIDNLTSNATDKALSANQGKGLNDKVVALQTKTRINYLRPSVPTQTVYGITCTNNGDGTYTFNGTATARAGFGWWLFGLNINKLPLKAVGSVSGIEFNIFASDSTAYFTDNGNGVIIDKYVDQANFMVQEGTTLNNVIVKPMLTDDLSATYDDFVSGFDCLTPDLKMDLLWENASPTSQFPSQTINLDLSKYKLLYITARYFAGDANDSFYTINRIGTVSVLTTYITDIGNGNIYNYQREVSSTINSITFTNAYRDNNDAVPIRIYGVR